MTHKRITMPEARDADLRQWIKSAACPACDSPSHVEAVEDEGTYVDDEAGYLTKTGLQFFPYKLYSCGSCGCQFRVLLGPVAIDITQDPDIDVPGWEPK